MNNIKCRVVNMITFQQNINFEKKKDERMLSFYYGHHLMYYSSLLTLNPSFVRLNWNFNSCIKQYLIKFHKANRHSLKQYDNVYDLKVVYYCEIKTNQLILSNEYSQTLCFMY